LARKIRGNFHLFLLFLSLQILAYPFLRAGFTHRIIMNLLLGALLVSGVLAFVQKRRVMIAALSLAVLTLVVAMVALVAPRPGLVIARQSLLAAFLMLAAGVLLKVVLGKGRVTGDKLSGAVCVYLLIGVIWSLLFGILEIAAPGSLHFPDADAGVQEAMRIGAPQGATTYFSFVTLTTLGYGDIVPVSKAARSLVAVEALLGQLYLTILVARLVGLHMTQSGLTRN
jgi:hypothetical protein